MKTVWPQRDDVSLDSRATTTGMKSCDSRENVERGGSSLNDLELERRDASDDFSSSRSGGDLLAGLTSVFR